MKKFTRYTRKQLKQSDSGPARFLSGPHVSLGEINKKSSTITILRTGSFSHPRYGRFEITRELFEGMVKNFEAKTYGQDIFMDVAHEPQKGNAGDITRLFVEGARLRATVQWTDYGLEAIQARGIKYISADFIENFTDSEFEKEHGPVLFGAALVTRPHIKNMDPVQLSEDDGQTTLTYIHPATLNHFKNEEKTVNKFLEALRAKYEALKFSEALIKKLLATFESAAKQLADNEEAIKLLAAEFEGTGDQLAKALGDAAANVDPSTVNIQLGDISVGNSDNLEDIVAKKLAEAETKRLTDAATAQATLDKLKKQFSDAIAAAEGLSEATTPQLMSAGDLITAAMTADQVKALAENQIALGNELEAQRQLSATGYQIPGVSGTPHIQHGDDTSSLKLQEDIDKGLKLSARADNLVLPEPTKVSSFVRQVLADFDRRNAQRLHEEAKQFAAGAVDMNSTNLPVGFQRTVIREALSDMNVLQLVNTQTDPTATVTTQIPYEERDVSQIVNEGIVYEGAEIPAGGIEQKMDTAWITQTKISLNVSNEVMHFTAASAINWDAYARNVESNARYVRELIARRICNEYQRSADSYLAGNIVDEALDAQITGANSLIKTAQFPIVRPHQVRDTQGAAQGSAEHPITLVINGTQIAPYDGTGNQAAGTYYRVTSYNMGYVQLVDETGAPVTPADIGVNTITYSYATNIQKFDLDIPGGTSKEVHLNGLLQAIGARKAVLSGDRFVNPDFQLMSPTLNDTATNAEQFTAAGQRGGSDTGAQGDLERVKGVNAWGTNAPAVDLGDERIILGQRGTQTYTIAKPYMTGTPFEAVGPNGLPTGKKVAYGEEYNSIKVPAPIRGRLTSVIAYSFTGR